MNKWSAATGLIVSGIYLYGILVHLLHPSANPHYTRVLMFSCLISAFLLAPAITVPWGWGVLRTQQPQLSGLWALVYYFYGGFCLLFPFLLVGFVAYTLGRGLFGLHPGIAVVLVGFFVPVILHWRAIGPWGMVMDALARLGLVIVAALAAKFIGDLLHAQAPERMEEYRVPMSHIVGGGDTGKQFLWVVFYALLNQAVSFYYAARALVAAKGPDW